MDSQELLRHFHDQTPQFIETLGQWVSCPSVSGGKDDINRFLDLLEQSFSAFAPVVHRLPGPAGDLLSFSFFGHKPEPVVLLAHSDTVRVPGVEPGVRIETDKMFGNGVLDMKQALAIFFFALNAIHSLDLQPRRSIRLLINPDEETGSIHSLPWLLQECRTARAVLLPEPCGPDGALKTRRKGVLSFETEFSGLAAHSGVNPDKGRDANRALAAFIHRVDLLRGKWPGLTFNPGLMSGGTQINVVAAESLLRAEIRSYSNADLAEAAAAIEEIRHMGDVTLKTTCRLLHAALEETGQNRALVSEAQTIARSLGTELPTCASGGASDGSDLAAAGIPVLDGLGMRGEGAHSVDEFVRLDDFPFRASLITSLCLEL